MAVDFKVAHTRTSEYLFEPKHLTVGPELNGRVDAPDIESMLLSLKATGQLQPLLIGNDGGKPYIIDGHSRWRAACEGVKRGALPKEFRLRCVYFRGDEAAEFRACVAANRERNGATPDDDAANIARFQRYGMTDQEIADFYHEDIPWVMGRLSRLSLTPDARQAVKDGKVKPNAVRVLAKLSREQQAEAVKAETVTVAACKAVVSGNGNGHVRGPSKSEVLRATIARAAEGDLPVDVVSMTPVAAVMEFAKYLMGEGK